MVAELLRLRLRLVANLYRGRGVVGRILGLLIAIALVVVVFAGLRLLTGCGAQFTARSTIGLGAVLSLGALLVPVIVARHELMPARAFLGFGVRRVLLIPLLALFTLIGPALVGMPLLFAPMGVWPADAGVAFGCGVLLVLQTLLALRIGAAIGAALRGRRRLGRWMRALAVVVLVATAIPGAAVVLTRVFLLVPDRVAPLARVVLRIVRPIDGSPAIDVLAASPVGVLWAAPAFPSLGQADRVAAAVLTGIATVLVLGLVWALVVLVQLSASRRRATEHALRPALGWFGRVPTGPAAAVAARSLSYWLRDPRYRSVFVILPVIPVLTLLALWVGGVPLPIGALVPLPIMVLVLAWSTTHNDIAYDSTAVWLHVASQTRGIDDRIGRSVPPLIFGGLLVAVGTPLTAWAFGDAAVVPAVLGVSLAVLLGGVGVGSGLSVRFPYAAPRPGDGPFRYPQVAGGAGGGAQGLSVFLIVLTALPALAAAGMWFVQGDGWNWIALAAGLVPGIVALVLGIRGGAIGFDRRGPELLAFTMRN